MHAAIPSALSLMLATFLPPSDTDRITLLRVDPEAKGARLFLTSNRPDGPAADFVGGLLANATKGPRTTGKKAARFAFPLDRDGDGIDEVAFVIERTKAKDGPLELIVHRAPQGTSGKLKKTVLRVKKGGIGHASGAEAVTAVGAADLDGDSRDELLIVTTSAGGAQSFAAYVLPEKKKAKSLPSPLATAGVAGSASDAIVSLFGADADGDGADELVLLRRTPAGDRIEVREAPVGSAATLPSPIASTTTVLPPATFSNDSVAAIAPFGDGEPHLLLAQTGPGDAARLVVHALPDGLGQAIGAPLLSDVTLGLPTVGAPLFAAFATRGEAEKSPLEKLTGGWRLTLAGVPPTEGPAPTYGPIDAIALLDGTTLTLVDGEGSPVDADLSAVDFPSGPVTFANSEVTYPLAGDQSVTLTFGASTLEVIDGTYHIHGASGVPVGVVLDDEGEEVGPIVSWTWERK